MKKLLRKTLFILKGFGYARAAAIQARLGNRQRAIEIMQEYERCK